MVRLTKPSRSRLRRVVVSISGNALDGSAQFIETHGATSRDNSPRAQSIYRQHATKFRYGPACIILEVTGFIKCLLCVEFVTLYSVGLHGYHCNKGVINVQVLKVAVIIGSTTREQRFAPVPALQWIARLVAERLNWTWKFSMS